MAPDKTNNQAARERLKAVLAAYGSDPARWPESDRKLAPLLSADDTELSAPLRDARAIDAALARGSCPEIPAGAAERLVAKVANEPSRVVPFAARAEGRPQPRRAAMPGTLAALSALAASLALGLYLGASGQGDWMIPPQLAEEPAEDLIAEFDILDPTLQFFEDEMEL